METGSRAHGSRWVSTTRTSIPNTSRRPRSEASPNSSRRGSGEGATTPSSWFAELDGRVVGWLFARLERPDENASSQFVREQSWIRVAVDGLVVDRPVWRRGVGTALLKAETWARDRGAELVRLDTYAGSPVSVPFYERMGYAR